MVTWWCPLSDAAHVLSAHVLPVAGLALLGAVAGDRVLAMRLRWRKECGIAKRFVSCDVAPSGGLCCRRLLAIHGSRRREAGEGGHHDP